ncbi:uncharacterized protein LOC102704451 [Oryza brachyantha]|uniref:uncharacterized protein LOC102704451 n=1 Tax=Oryza brachyantha TaxID=4533 RepID=UPI0007761111|nr:uncharacterized protein LOC102704451 [Oryza brachyantha]
MKKKSCHGRATAAYDLQHSLPKITGETTDHQHGNISGTQAAKNKTWKKRYLTFLSKFQNKMKHKKPDSTKAAGGSKNHHHHHHRNPTKRSLLPSSQILEECSNLVQVIRQTTADCFAAAATAVAASVDYEDDQPYMQLDQVNYGVKREAFGPVYLVT